MGWSATNANQDYPLDPQSKPYSDKTSALANVEEALALLRSAGEIAARNGAQTNWPAFYKSVESALARFGLRPVSARTYRLPHGEG